MRDYIDEACDNIDAAMFTGDAFDNPEEGIEHRRELRNYIGRWTRQMSRNETWELFDVLKKVANDEHSNITCVNLALRELKPKMVDIETNTNPHEVYDEAMNRMKVDFDKLRGAQTEAGKVLEQLIKDWQDRQWSC